jgi:hypothetical protein
MVGEGVQELHHELQVRIEDGRVQLKDEFLQGALQGSQPEGLRDALMLQSLCEAYKTLEEGVVIFFLLFWFFLRLHEREAM